jgi:hypothetical protein
VKIIVKFIRKGIYCNRVKSGEMEKTCFLPSMQEEGVELSSCFDSSVKHFK